MFQCDNCGFDCPSPVYDTLNDFRWCKDCWNARLQYIDRKADEKERLEREADRASQGKSV